MTSGGSQPDQMLVGLVAFLRYGGLDIPLSSSTEFVRAAAEVGMESRQGLLDAGLATLVRSPSATETYRRLFDLYWARGQVRMKPEQDEIPMTLAVDDGPAPNPDETAGAKPSLELRWSAAERLGHRDFTTYDAEDWELYDRLCLALGATAIRRRTRRLSRPHATGEVLDLRASMAETIRSDGELVRLERRRRKYKARLVVTLVDVSGSMSGYARAYLRFVQAVSGARGGRARGGRAGSGAGGGAEAFTFGTRLTRVTAELANYRPDQALQALADRVQDWSGGTRLGPVLEEFLNTWGARGMARGAVVVICSDGWDRGDPEQLNRQMARLRRLVHTLVWVNPLKASPGYAPLARGMATALPYVDHFVEGHSWAAMEHLAAVVSGAVESPAPGASGLSPREVQVRPGGEGR